MAASVDNESEILLGNKQLLAVFAVMALLLAVAFTGGYMLGKNSAAKKVAGSETASESAPSEAGNVTKTVTPDDSQAAKTDVPPPPAEEPRTIAAPVAVAKPVVRRSDVIPVLGAPKGSSPEGTPKPGQTFLQVMAVTHTQAAATAEVLRKQNYPARIAPKPGSSTLYRVLVGPVKDAGDLAATRDSLRKIGFRDVYVQRY